MRPVTAAAAASGSRSRSAFLDVGDDRDAAGLRHGLERRDEGHRRNDHLLARARGPPRSARYAARRGRSTSRRSGQRRSRRRTPPRSVATAGPFTNAPESMSSGEILEEIRRERGVCPAEVHERHRRGTRLHSGRSVIGVLRAALLRCKTPLRDGAGRPRAPPPGGVEPRERQRHVCAARRAREARRAGDPPEGRIPPESPLRPLRRARLRGHRPPRRRRQPRCRGGSAPRARVPVSRSHGGRRKPPPPAGVGPRADRNPGRAPHVDHGHGGVAGRRLGRALRGDRGRGHRAVHGRDPQSPRHGTSHRAERRPPRTRQREDDGRPRPGSRQSLAVHLACGGRARRTGGRASRVRCGSAPRSTG